MAGKTLAFGGLSEAQLYDFQLRARVERLQKLIALGAPPQIIAAEVMLVNKAAIGFCGEHYAAAQYHEQLKAVRFGMARCIECGHEGVEDAYGLCPRCLKGDADEAQAEAAADQGAETDGAVPEP